MLWLILFSLEMIFMMGFGRGMDICNFTIRHLEVQFY